MIIIILLGHNVFLWTGCGSPISIITDKSVGKRFYFTNSPNNPYVEFLPNVNISIKEVRLYTFEKKNPFIKIKNTILMWKNETYKASRQIYHIEVKVLLLTFRKTLRQLGIKKS